MFRLVVGLSESELPHLLFSVKRNECVREAKPSRWNMPCETDLEKEKIRKRIVLMTSFSLVGSHPKMQNWFSWNACDYRMSDEFYGTKCVYEAMLGTKGLDPIVDDQEFSIAPGVDLRQELKRLLKDSGGIALAFRLMRDDLYLYTQLLATAEKAPATCKCLPTAAQGSDSFWVCVARARLRRRRPQTFSKPAQGPCQLSFWRGFQAGRPGLDT